MTGRTEAPHSPPVPQGAKTTPGVAVRILGPRRAWQPPPVFLPGESHGERSLAGYSPRGCKESDTTEQLSNSSNCLYPRRVDTPPLGRGGPAERTRGYQPPPQHPLVEEGSHWRGSPLSLLPAPVRQPPGAAQGERKVVNNSFGRD